MEALSLRFGEKYRIQKIEIESPDGETRELAMTPNAWEGVRYLAETMDYKKHDTWKKAIRVQPKERPTSAVEHTIENEIIVLTGKDAKNLRDRLRSLFDRREDFIFPEMDKLWAPYYEARKAVFDTYGITPILKHSEDSWVQQQVPLGVDAEKAKQDFQRKQQLRQQIIDALTESLVSQPKYQKIYQAIAASSDEEKAVWQEFTDAAQPTKLVLAKITPETDYDKKIELHKLGDDDGAYEVKRLEVLA